MGDFALSHMRQFADLVTELTPDQLESAYVSNYSRMPETAAPDYTNFRGCMPATPYNFGSQLDMDLTNHFFPINTSSSSSADVLRTTVIEPLGTGHTSVPDHLVRELEHAQFMRDEAAREHAARAPTADAFIAEPPRHDDAELRAEIAACRAEAAELRESIDEAQGSIERSRERYQRAIETVREALAAMEECSRRISASDAALAALARRTDAFAQRLGDQPADMSALESVAAVAASRPYAASNSPVVPADRAVTPVNRAVSAFTPGMPRPPLPAQNHKPGGRPVTPVVVVRPQAPEPQLAPDSPECVHDGRFAGKRPVPPPSAPAKPKPRSHQKKRVVVDLASDDDDDDDGAAACVPVKSKPALKPKPKTNNSRKSAAQPVMVVHDEPREPTAEEQWFSCAMIDARASKAAQEWSERHAFVLYMLSDKWEQKETITTMAVAESLTTDWLARNTGPIIAEASRVAVHLPEGVRVMDYWSTVCHMLDSAPRGTWDRVELIIEAARLEVADNDCFQLANVGRLRLVNANARTHWGCIAQLLDLSAVQDLTLLGRIPPAAVAATTNVKSFAELPLDRLRSIAMHCDTDQEPTTTPGAWATYRALSASLRRTADRASAPRPDLRVMLPPSTCPSFMHAITTELMSIRSHGQAQSIRFVPASGAQAAAIVSSLFGAVKRTVHDSLPGQATKLRSRLALLELPEGNDTLHAAQSAEAVVSILQARYRRRTVSQ
jgi:hypothetical protein